MLASLPKLPNLAQAVLDEMPTPMEIKEALMALGPEKSAGPGGINARLLR